MTVVPGECVFVWARAHRTALYRAMSRNACTREQRGFMYMTRQRRNELGVSLGALLHTAAAASWLCARTRCLDAAARPPARTRPARATAERHKFLNTMEDRS